MWHVDLLDIVEDHADQVSDFFLHKPDQVSHRVEQILLLAFFRSYSLAL